MPGCGGMAAPHEPARGLSPCQPHTFWGVFPNFPKFSQVALRVLPFWEGGGPKPGWDRERGECGFVPICCHWG